MSQRFEVLLKHCGELVEEANSISSDRTDPDGDLKVFVKKMDKIPTAPYGALEERDALTIMYYKVLVKLYYASANSDSRMVGCIAHGTGNLMDRVKERVQYLNKAYDLQ